MIAPDTSVAVAAALLWHESHELARSALGRNRAPLLAQVAIETYSVLTRLPPPQRVPPRVASEYLATTFVFPVLMLPNAAYAPLLGLLAEEGIGGGAVYDAVVACTAKEARARLVTLDRRALPVYQLVGAQYELLR